MSDEFKRLRQENKDLEEQIEQLQHSIEVKALNTTIAEFNQKLKDSVFSLDAFKMIRKFYVLHWLSKFV